MVILNIDVQLKNVLFSIFNKNNVEIQIIYWLIKNPKIILWTDINNINIINFS